MGGHEGICRLTKPSSFIRIRPSNEITNRRCVAQVYRPTIFICSATATNSDQATNTLWLSTTTETESPAHRAIMSTPRVWEYRPFDRRPDYAIFAVSALEVCQAVGPTDCKARHRHGGTERECLSGSHRARQPIMIAIDVVAVLKLLS